MMLRIASLTLFLLLVGETAYIATHRYSPHRFEVLKGEDEGLAPYPTFAFDTETGSVCRAYPKTMPPESKDDTGNMILARKLSYCPDVR
jgi:hypothetical protein